MNIKNCGWAKAILQDSLL